MRLAPITPDAVPDRIIWIVALALLGRMTPPLDFVTFGSAATPAFFSAACSEPR